MFCPYCGSQTVEGACFCVKCGKQLPNINNTNVSAQTQTSSSVVQTQQVPQQVVPNNQVVQQTILPNQQPSNLFVSQPVQRIGFSNAINTAKFKSKLWIQKFAAFIFALIIIPLPFIGFVAYSFFSDKMKMQEALTTGACVSGIFLLFYIFYFLKRAFTFQWEGVVIGKFVEEKSRWRSYSSDSRRYESKEYYDVYVVKIQTDSGSFKRIENNSEDSYYYSYFNIGDRVKFHPSIDYYEKYDKSHDTHLLCPLCAKVNPITEDYCKCGAPIIK